MGITNIHILQNPEPDSQSARKLQEYVAARRIVEHRGGQHPWGSKRRDCPLCQSGK
jgi:hypothetical protein